MMSQTFYSELTSELKDILLRERDLLKAGHAAETAGLVKRKTEIMHELWPHIDAVEKGEASQDKLEEFVELRDLATENALRFASVQNGLRSLLERLADQNDNTRIGAYDQSGKQMQFDRSSGAYKKSL